MKAAKSGVPICADDGVWLCPILDECLPWLTTANNVGLGHGLSLTTWGPQGLGAGALRGFGPGPCRDAPTNTPKNLENAFPPFLGNDDVWPPEPEVKEGQAPARGAPSNTCET